MNQEVIEQCIDADEWNKSQHLDWEDVHNYTPGMPFGVGSIMRAIVHVEDVVDEMDTLWNKRGSNPISLDDVSEKDEWRFR